MIPKIIHYCWLSDEQIPEKLQNYMKTWKEKLPDYEFIKWDFSRFDKSSSCWVKEAFDNKKYAFAADYIRLYAIYSMGGIYLDMDIEVLRPFDELLDSDYLFAYENPLNNGIEAGCFGACKNNDFIKTALEYYSNRHFIMQNGDFDMKPLPMILQKKYSEFNRKFTIYDWHMFTNKSFETGIETTTNESYAIHHFAGSWKTDNEKNEILLHQLLKRKYGKYGDILYKIHKYVFNPKNLVHRIFK